jgi:hypothetical protein
VMPCAVVVPSSFEFHFDDQCYLLHCDALTTLTF